jgi:hypothetical protein
LSACRIDDIQVVDHQQISIDKSEPVVGPGDRALGVPLFSEIACLINPCFGGYTAGIIDSSASVQKPEYLCQAIDFFTEFC